MAQAKALTQQELEQVLRYVSTKRYAQRDRALVMTSFLSGMRAKEIASLKFKDILNDDGTVKNEIRLTADMTKGRHGRVVFVSHRLQEELAAYARSRATNHPYMPVFFTSNRAGFNPNGLCQHFWWMYKRAGISGASSHSGRRSFITSLAEKGIGVRVLASLAGHRSIAVTQRYIDVNDEMKRRAVELI